MIEQQNLFCRVDQLGAPAEHGEGLHLLESRLSEDQRTSDEGGCYRIRARIPATQRLKWWLRGFGDDVTVVAPADHAFGVHPRRVEVAV